MAQTASIAEIIVMVVLLAALPAWCLWQKDVKTRHFGIVAIIGGVLGFVLTVAEDVRWQVEYARSLWVLQFPQERTLLDEVVSILSRNNLPWRAYLSFAALGMLASMLSLLILGPFLIRRTAAREPEPASDEPARKTLAQLVAGITPENLHGEWNTGPDVGKEIR